MDPLSSPETSTELDDTFSLSELSSDCPSSEEEFIFTEDHVQWEHLASSSSPIPEEYCGSASLLDVAYQYNWRCNGSHTFKLSKSFVKYYCCSKKESGCPAKLEMHYPGGKSAKWGYDKLLIGHNHLPNPTSRWTHPEMRKQIQSELTKGVSAKDIHLRRVKNQMSATCLIIYYLFICLK